MFICYTYVVLIYPSPGESPFASEGPPTALSLAPALFLHLDPPSFSFLAVWGAGRYRRGDTRPPDRAQSPGRSSLLCWHVSRRPFPPLFARCRHRSAKCCTPSITTLADFCDHRSANQRRQRDWLGAPNRRSRWPRRIGGVRTEPTDLDDTADGAFNDAARLISDPPTNECANNI